MVRCFDNKNSLITLQREEMFLIASDDMSGIRDNGTFSITLSSSGSGVTPLSRWAILTVWRKLRRLVTISKVCDEVKFSLVVSFFSQTHQVFQHKLYLQQLPFFASLIQS